MAIQTERRRVCDVCGSADDVKQFKINYVSDSQTRSIDLCGEHQNFGLEDVRELMPGGKRGRPRGQDVVSVAEVKRNRRSGTAKKAASAKKAAPRKRS